MKAQKAGKEESQPKFLPMVRRGLGTKGPKIQLQSNHFRVRVGIKDGFFYHYSVAMSYEDGNPVEAKGIGRKVIDKVYETYDELKSKNFAYDGEKSLFTLGSLKENKMEFTVVLEDLTSRRAGRSDAGLDSPTDGEKKRMRRQSQSKNIKVVISYPGSIEGP
ncbi:Protein argonaute-4 [Stylosanthes scabra]|uniref:Protein argonaute-4 n=1 Tax=Stylosanthes scabra TaxID=79078 RepID=A0ABU6X134_9FABA|nr:Protein argonaute-4 [Stylosanthes scabra]